ncbi:uncharacterized protein LOC132194044 isoform X2 [Neocloeon triangulifer]|uniref:uncharacterized protein LOC132194044 isoform X2 n=1 Tax=Neocloeon triangulifer TaxID=2078957 RepID=UPI00286F382F|nr:uncharacterized protein LOC132194044 isoform X2 [Neocloeon triangulifer]
MIRSFNETKEKLDRLTNLVYNQVLGSEKVVAEVRENFTKFSKNTNGRLEALAELVDRRLNQTVVNLEQKLEDLENRQHKEFAEVKTLISCTPAKSGLKTLSNGKMYFFSHPVKGNWAVANETCDKKGLNLVTIKDLNDLKVLWAEVKRIGSARNYGIEEQMIDFRWPDGSTLGLDSPLWREDGDVNNGCVYFYSGVTEKLNSDSCSANLFFVCELPSECYV